MILKDGFVLRQVAGHYLVVPVGAQTMNFNGIITLNETGAFLWQCLQTEKTADELTAALLEEYDVTAAMASADVSRFVKKLQEADLLK